MFPPNMKHFAIEAESSGILQTILLAAELTFSTNHNRHSLPVVILGALQPVPLACEPHAHLVTVAPMLLIGLSDSVCGVATLSQTLMMPIFCTSRSAAVRAVFCMVSRRLVISVALSRRSFMFLLLLHTIRL